MMKHLQNSAKTISIFDDEKTFGSVDAEQYPTAPIAEDEVVHPLRGFINSALNLIATKEDREVLGDETDEYDDHLIPLGDDEEDELEIGDGHFAIAASFIDGIAQSLNAESDEAKSPLLLAAFRSRFLG